MAKRLISAADLDRGELRVHVRGSIPGALPADGHRPLWIAHFRKHKLKRHEPARLRLGLTRYAGVVFDALRAAASPLAGLRPSAGHTTYRNNLWLVLSLTAQAWTLLRPA